MLVKHKLIRREHVSRPSSSGGGLGGLGGIIGVGRGVGKGFVRILGIEIGIAGGAVSQVVASPMLHTIPPTCSVS
jgi:hypothetical protein